VGVCWTQDDSEQTIGARLNGDQFYRWRDGLIRAGVNFSEERSANAQDQRRAV
jgi:hypothetical protein